MVSTIRDNPLRKVAILIASLDEQWSKRILDSLPSDQALIVRQRVEQLSKIDPMEQQEILREFRRNLTESCVGNDRGVELDVSLQEQHPLEDALPIAAKPSAANPSPALRSLSGADTSFIVEMLVSEHPQTIALVLSRLDAEQAAEVLGKFSPPDQADIMQRLSGLDTIDEESVQVVESQVARWISEQRERKARMSAGMELVQQIMSKTPRSSREVLLTELNKKNSVLAVRLAREPVSRESQKPVPRFPQSITAQTPVKTNQTSELPKALSPQPVKTESTSPFSILTAEQCLLELESLDTSTLLTALSQCESHVVRLALVSASERLLKRLLAGQSRREAKQFRQSLREIGPTRIRDIVSAQQQLLEIASKLRT